VLEVMTQYLRVIWPKNSEIKDSPAKRIVNLAYDQDSIEKAQIDFAIKVGATNSYLSSDSPIKVNGKVVKLTDIPQSSSQLGDISRESIEVGHLLKFHPDGKDNVFEVNFINKSKKFFSKKSAGTLNMTLKLAVPDKVVTVEKKVDPVDKIFCIFCGASIQSDSMYCPYGGQLLTTGGTDVKECKNCGEALPPVAVYCRKCQALQGQSSYETSSDISGTEATSDVSSPTESAPFSSGTADPYSSQSKSPFEESADSSENIEPSSTGNSENTGGSDTDTSGSSSSSNSGTSA
jgi:hypothetical protein